MTASTAPRFPARVTDAIGEAVHIAIRAGVRPHRFIAIWAVVVKGRVFVRPWDNREGGWYRVFQEEPRGAIQVNGRTVRVRGVLRGGERLLGTVDRAYREKYTRPSHRIFVSGFARPTRRRRTLELVPGWR